MAEEGLGQPQPRNHDRIAADERTGEARLGGNNGGGRNIAACAQILGKGRADEGAGIEAGEVEGHLTRHPELVSGSMRDP